MSALVKQDKQYTPAKWQAMVTAIAECHRVDEVAEMHNQALALEVYARQAMDVESERKACEVRLRAERRAGELLAGLERNRGGDRKSEDATNRQALPIDSEYRQTLDQTGINERTARRWQQLAAVPSDEFEEALGGAEKPSTTRILASAAPVPKMNPRVLAAWGVLRRWEEDNFYSTPLAQMLDGMTETMQADVARIAPMMIEWLQSIQENLP